jgi:N-methylhydantoinase A
MHAAAIAAELGIGRIVCPRASGVLSALGLCASERRRDTARTVMLSGEELTAESLAAEVEELAGAAGAGLKGATAEVEFGMRYRGQAFELAIPGPERPDPAALAEQFAVAHEERYGYRDPEAEVELVDVRVAMVVPGPGPSPRATGSEPREATRRARFGGEWLEARVVRGDPPAGFAAAGPAIFEMPESTLVLPPGWTAEVDEAGSIVADREGD